MAPFEFERTLARPGAAPDSSVATRAVVRATPGHARCTGATRHGCSCLVIGAFDESGYLIHRRSCRRSDACAPTRLGVLRDLWPRPRRILSAWPILTLPRLASGRTSRPIETLETSTIYGMPSLKWPGAKSHALEALLARLFERYEAAHR